MRDECDLLVLSSRVETFGCVAIEALASGKPVVSTACGGPEGIVTSPYLGEICSNDDPEALAEAVLKVIGNTGAYPAELIRRHAEETFSYRKIASCLAAVYTDVLGGVGAAFNKGGAEECMRC
jgi:glycosyltransferase involved in cell wall biosynthesis